MRYVARGVVAVVSPWNFPIAIPCGMVAAGLATGLPRRPQAAEQSPACGLMVVQALRSAGVPPGAISLLPGDGEAGAALVRHPGVATVAFTGVGPRRPGDPARRGAGRARAATAQAVVAEMGGKNCVIVDSDADLDEVVPPSSPRPSSTPAEVLGRVARARPRGDRRAAARARSPARWSCWCGRRGDRSARTSRP
jgi:RHH-type proline utilization regulon transcriptional repressor/proline dehydrogenase/delta 1-pyrroline-5-carboxylate dehydrogenase